MTHYRKVWSAVLVQHSQKELRTVGGIAPTDPRSLYPPLTPGVRRAPPPAAPPPWRGFVWARRCSWHRRNTGRSGALPVWTLGSVAPQAPLSPQPSPGFTNPLTAEKAPAGFGIRTASLMPSAAAALKRRPLRSKTLCFWKRGMSGHDQRSVRSTLNRCRHRALLSSRKLVLNIFLKLSEQTFNFDNLSFHLRERGLRRFADPHLLSKQAFQLGQLPLKGVDHIDCCLCHACGPAPCAQHMLMWDRMREEMRQCRRRLPQSTDTPPTQDRHRRPKCRWDALWPDGPALPRAPPAPAPGAGPGHFKFAVSMTGSAGPDPVLT